MDSLRAYTDLEGAILTGELKPRQRLVEQELAERLGMSRTPIREALRRLEERGLVRILPHRGAIVADISPVDVENIYAVRCHLESLAAQLAAERITPGVIEQVIDLEAAQSGLSASRDVRALMHANDSFHDTIYGATENPCLVEVIQQLRRQVHPVRFNAWSKPDRIARSLAEHREMVDVLRRRDGARLAELTQQHLRVAKEAYLTSLGVRPQGGRRGSKGLTAAA
jgi:DNA-binding GntR family transcriptional regulator